MTTTAVAAIAGLVFGWAVVSGALGKRSVTGPLVFATAGYLLSNPGWGPVPIDGETSSIHVIAEVTLALLLFSDAARVNVGTLRHDPALPVRLLGVGLPLAVVAGAVLAAVVFDLPWALALFLGAALAPTDAALSVQVINDERVPMRLRQALNVESGLNDGIVTPIVSVALAIAASQLGEVSESLSVELGSALLELGIGAAIGAVVGVGGATVLTIASRRDWIAPGGRRLAVLALALSGFAVALSVDANGFIAAFVAGAAFGAAVEREDGDVDVERSSELPELGGELLALVVWFLFGAALLPMALEHLSVQLVLYTALSLTVVRMVPVALGMVGGGLDRPATAFLAWFGPRGLASVVFALLAIEQLGDANDAANVAVAAVALTVAASVVLHGLTAGPGGRLVQHEHGDERTGPRARSSGLVQPVRRPRPHPRERPAGP
jgi:NhaP-type Na+/H+ or K+/H+ antiporter